MAIEDRARTPKLEDLKEWEGRNFYERLGVSVNATTSEITTAFQKLYNKFDPSLVRDNKELCENYTQIERFLREALKTLGDGEARKKYDEGLGKQ